MPQHFPYGLNPIPLNASNCDGTTGPFPSPAEIASTYSVLSPTAASTESLASPVPSATPNSNSISLPTPTTGAADLIWAVSKSVLLPQLGTLIETFLTSNDPMNIPNPGESLTTVLSDLTLQPPGVVWGSSGPTLSLGGRFAYPFYLNIPIPFTGNTKLVFLRYLHGSFVVNNISLQPVMVCTPSGPGVGCGTASLGRAFCDPRLGACPVAGLTATGPYQDCYPSSNLQSVTMPNVSSPPMTRINDLAVSMALASSQMVTTLDPGDEAYVISLTIGLVIASIIQVPISMTLLPALLNAISGGPNASNAASNAPPQGRPAWTRIGLANGGGLGTVRLDLYTQSGQFTGGGLVLGCRLVPVGSLTTLGAVADAGSSCFVATAVLGTSLHPKVQVLRRFRDEILMNYWWGRSLNAVYLKVSPPIADIIRRSRNLRRVIRPMISGAADVCERWFPRGH